MGRGIINNYQVAADVVFDQTIVPATVGLASPIAAGERQNLRWWVPFSVGATGGIRAVVSVPAGGTIFLASFMLVNTVAPAIVTPQVQVASAAVTNALANAGNHWLEVNATIVNGATAGNVDLLIAQNTSDVLVLTVLQGAALQAVII